MDLGEITNQIKVIEYMNALKDQVVPVTKLLIQPSIQ